MNENTSDESVQNSEFPDQNSEVPIDKELKAQPIIVNVSPTPVNVNIPQFDDTEDAKANQIAKWGILINLLATVMTLFALFFTWKSVNVSVDALAMAKASDSTSRAIQYINDSLNARKDSLATLGADLKDLLSRQRDSLSFLKDATTISLAQKSLQAQINSAKEQSQHFDIENRPIIQISNLQIDSALGCIACNIENVGKVPAKSISMKFYLDYYDAQIGFFSERPSEEKFEKFTLPQSIFKYASVPVVFCETKTFTSDEFISLQKGEGEVWLFSKIYYSSTYSSQMFKASLVFRIDKRNNKFQVDSKEYEDVLIK